MYNVTDVDLFRKLEIEIGLNLHRGEVYFIKDLNSRIGKKQDYPINDSSSRVDIENNVMCMDQPQRRLSADVISNRFGDCLLDLCKAVNICIVNGRLFKNTHVLIIWPALRQMVKVLWIMLWRHIKIFIHLATSKYTISMSFPIMHRYLFHLKLERSGQDRQTQPIEKYVSGMTRSELILKIHSWRTCIF